jgi:uroporphyrin-III C-methyltransferase
MVETTSGLPSFPAPQGGASLLLSFRLERKTVVVVGANMLAASRAFAALEANAKVVVLCPKGREGACEELQWRAGQGQVTIVDPLLTSSTSSSNPESAVLEHMLSDPHTQVHLVCVTDTVLGEGRRSRQSAADLAKICRSYRVPVNVTDEPTLCDFSFTATHRFVDATSGEHTPLQVGVTTNGQGCRLAGRVRREIVARLPKTVGGATLGVSRLREMTKHGANDEGQRLDAEAEEGEDSTTPTPNKPVTQRQLNDVETPAEQIRRQMRWVAQVSEYWPLGQLASMNNADAAKVLTGGFDSPPTTKHRPPLAHASDTEFSSLHSLAMTSPAASPRKGRIFLVGSGPGHPSLLTRATHTALTELADLVLSDKLVPSAVLELIPPSVKVQIARKFPGNAEGAQTEMMEAAVEAANRGLTVVRVRVTASYHVLQV